MNTIKKIADCLNVSADTLVGIEDHQPSSIAVHFDSEEYTDAELEEIRQFGAFVKDRRK